ncbi:MAG: endonuclease III [Thermoplasmatota archaeon]
MARESQGARRERAKAILHGLSEAYPRSTCSLRHDGPFQLLVATLLSAQTTDVAVNRVTPALFERFPGASELAAAPAGSVETLIGSIGLWRSKAKHLRAMAREIVELHGGRVPSTLEELTTLTGVGRKTATAVLGMGFRIPAGVTVDTHMMRINRRLGLSRAATPERMALELERLLPEEAWISYTHRVIDHGRLTCTALRPRCGVCPLSPYCPSAFSTREGYRVENDLREPASARGLSWLGAP